MIHFVRPSFQSWVLALLTDMTETLKGGGLLLHIGEDMSSKCLSCETNYVIRIK